MIRPVQGIWSSLPTIEGAGVRLRRAFGFAEVPKLDPFLLLDDFSSGNPLDYLPGFPWHPHRGIETVTYMVNGRVKHEDSIGNKGMVKSGEVQWMTAGSGIVHQEMPQKSEQQIGFQLWANLPKARKMMDPRYQDVGRAEIPEIDVQGAEVKVICGSVGGNKGPVQDIMIKPEYFDVSLPAGTGFEHAVPKGHKVFAYVISGDGLFDPKREANAQQLVLWGDGDMISINAKTDLRFLLISGKPLGEPIAWYGPIVMNTREELQKAFSEYEQGTFVKKRAKSGLSPGSPTRQ